MRITIVYRYFWPDTPPYAVMLREMTAWFATEGHKVEVLTAQPSYKPEAEIPRQPWRETVGGVSVRRLPLLPERGPGFTRWINSALFVALAIGVIAFGRRRDLVWTATMPPVLQAATLRPVAQLRGAKFLYQMQDIYPEIGIASQTLRNGMMARFLRWLDTLTLRKSDAVVVLSDDMESVIKERGANPRRLRTINNFALTEDGASRPAKQAGNAPLKFVFAGNIGRFQNLETLVEVFAKLSPEEAQLELTGEGRVKAKLVALVRQRQIANVTFRDHMAVEQMASYLSQADVGIVSLSPGIYRYAFPSKTLTYLAAGLPILAMVEDGSALQRVIASNRVGVSVPWEAGIEGLVAGVRNIIEEIRAGRVTSDIPRSLYHAQEARRSWVKLIAELDPAREGGRRP